MRLRKHINNTAGFSPGGDAAGAILLEVVLALVLFVAAAAVIAGAVNASLEGVQRQKLSTHAVNLAMTVLAELQIGLRSMEGGSPQPFAAPFEHWTWQLNASVQEEQGQSPTGLTLVEVVVRHDDPPFVHRLAQRIALSKPARTAGPPEREGGWAGQPITKTRTPGARLAAAAP
jgi:hypothetical protein